MDTAYIATALALRDLKCNSIESIEDRILLQKKIYLAQDIGLPLGYGYGWYLHGPYSTDLTAVAYQIMPEEINIEDKKFKEPYAKLIEQVNSLEDRKNDTIELGKVQWYELLASIAYWYARGKTKLGDIVAKLKVCKPQFNETQVEEAYAVYKEFKKSSLKID